jgi:hypothetical protein
MDHLEPDPIEHELRDVLTDERRALSPDLVSLDAVYAGAARRRRRRTAVVAAAGAFVLAGAAVPLSIALLDNDQPRNPLQATASVGPATPTPQHTPTTSPSSPEPSLKSSPPRPASPAWDGARVMSVTATSTASIVVLGALGDTGACKPPDCVRLAQSRDGGRTFTPLAVPPAALAGGTGGQLRRSATNVRFGSANDGWLYGDGMWATHDGGSSWHAVAMQGDVSSLAAAHGVVWALVGANGGNDQQLWRSPVGSDSWTQVPDVTVPATGDVAVFGSRVIVLGAGPTSKVWVSKDGTTFTAHPSPCTSAMAAQLSASGSLWAKCVTGTAAYVVTSANGVHWNQVKASQDGGSAPNGLTLGARGPDDAILALDAIQPIVDLLADGTQQAVKQPPALGASIDYLGFTSPSVGYAIDGTHLWRTGDGGNSWTRLQIR